MKFLPRKYRESQRDWFSKRGISWHVTVAIRKGLDGEMQMLTSMLTFVNVFESCTQDSCTVVAVMSNVLERLKEIIPALKSVYYWQDNAGCYHCGSTIVIAEICGRRHGLNVKRMDFADPQGGKGACDRKAATIKSHMKIFHDEGNNIESASDMKAAILSSGGVPAVNVAVSGPPDDSEFPKIEIKGVSFYTNVEYMHSGFKVWKFYNIGEGKVIPRNKFNIPSLSVPQLTNLDKESQVGQSEFLTVKSKKKSQKEDDSQPENSPVSTCKEDTTCNQNESHLYPVQNRGVSSVINVFLPYSDILIVENTNVSLKKKHFLIEQLLVTLKGSTSSLAAFLHYRHSKVQNHLGSMSFPWAGPSNLHKQNEHVLPINRKTT